MAEFNNDGFYQSGYSYEGSAQGPQGWDGYSTGTQYPGGSAGYSEGYPSTDMGQMSGEGTSSYPSEHGTGFEDEPPLLEGMDWAALYDKGGQYIRVVWFRDSCVPDLHAELGINFGHIKDKVSA